MEGARWGAGGGWVPAEQISVATVNIASHTWRWLLKVDAVITKTPTGDLGYSSLGPFAKSAA